MAHTYTQLDGGKAVKISSDTADETSRAPTTSATDGLSLNNANGIIRGIVVFAEAAASTFTVGSKLRAYIFNQFTGAWARADALDLTLCESGTASAKQCFSGIYVPVNGGRITFLPGGVGQSCDIYIAAQLEK